MNPNSINISLLIIILEFLRIHSFNFNDYFQSYKNQKIVYNRNQFVKYDLVQVPVENLVTKSPSWEQSLVHRKPLRQSKKITNNQYVWDEEGKFWTYKERFQQYPDNFNNDQQVYFNPQCKPPFCYPRRCNGMKCSQSNCLLPPQLCPRSNTDCSSNQKLFSFGSKSVCIDKTSDSQCSPDCGRHGICVKEKCYCETGYHGNRCSMLTPDFCRQKKQLICAHGCSYDNRINDFNCVCGDKEPKSNCIELRTCPKECKNNGVCLHGKCQCSDGFDGEQCELEINYCSSGQMGNKTCEHICVPDGRDKFQCKCRHGYQLNNDGRSCNKNQCSPIGTIETYGDNCKCKSGWEGPYCNQDINECLEYQICQQICVNMPGSYKCSCREGFTLVSDGRCLRSCLNNCSGKGDCLNGICYCFGGWYGEDCSIDIDECKYNHGCEHKCLNLPGTFQCQCFEGFKLQPNNKHCKYKDCVKPCRNNGICHNNKCNCTFGFTGSSCEIIDYCQIVAPCEHNCNLVNNRVICSCRSGFKLRSDGMSCSKDCKCINGRCIDDRCVCYDGFIGEDCSQPSCDYHCQQGKCFNETCICHSGYQGRSCNEDINECLSSHKCEQLCINTIGSYKCNCTSNYTIASDGYSCNLNQCHKCKNGKCMASNSCICNRGYHGQWCDQDIDECTLKKGLCEHHCINTEGSYKCFCNPGFVLDDNQHSCVSHCSLCQNGKCDHNQRCKCKTGWSGEICNIDINECLLGTHKCMHNCINTNGSYVCSCNQPYHLSTFDGRSCLENKLCAHPCKNGGTCVNLKCKCKVGYEGPSCEQDINECLLPQSVHGCIGECRNTFGSYECICPPGYMVLDDMKTCKVSAKDTMCNPHCLNGGVCRDMSRCFCPTGFQGSDCSKDVNECLRYKPCDKKYGTCQNTYGSFYCQCNNGYVLMNDGTSCMTVKEAIAKPHLRYRGRGTKGITRIIEN